MRGTYVVPSTTEPSSTSVVVLALGRLLSPSTRRTGGDSSPSSSDLSLPGATPSSSSSSNASDTESSSRPGLEARGRLGVDEREGLFVAVVDVAEGVVGGGRTLGVGPSVGGSEDGRAGGSGRGGGGVVPLGDAVNFVGLVEVSVRDAGGEEGRRGLAQRSRTGGSEGRNALLERSGGVEGGGSPGSVLVVDDVGQLEVGHFDVE